MKRLKMLAIAGLSLLAMSACTVDKNQAAKDPVDAAKNLTVAVRENDFDRLSHIMVPPDLYAKMEAHWKEEQAKKPAPTPEESKQFADQVAKFTAPDAEEKLFADLQPKLAQYGPQIPAGIAMMSGPMAGSIDQNPKLSASEKSQAKAVLTAVVQWAQTAHLEDQEKAKQAIKVFVGTARDLHLTTLEEAQKMSFQEAMKKAGIVSGGMRKMLAVYGFDTDKMLDSVKVEKKSESGDNAVVTVTYMILNAPITVDMEMVKRDGRWYSADLIKNIESSLNNTPAAPPVAEPTAPPAMPGPENGAPAGSDMPASSGDAPTEEAAPAAPAGDASTASG